MPTEAQRAEQRVVMFGDVPIELSSAQEVFENPYTLKISVTMAEWDESVYDIVIGRTFPKYRAMKYLVTIQTEPATREDAIMVTVQLLKMMCAVAARQHPAGFDMSTAVTDWLIDQIESRLRLQEVVLTSEMRRPN